MGSILCPLCGKQIWDRAHGHKLNKCWNAHGEIGPFAFDEPLDGPREGTYVVEVGSGDDSEALAEWLEAFADLDTMPLTDVNPISASGGGWSAEIVDYPTPTSATVAVTYAPEDGDD